VTRRMILALLLAGAATAAAAQDPPKPAGASLRPSRSVSLPSSQVKDTFFAYVLGIIATGVEVDVDNVQMREILTEFKSSLSLPFDLIARVTQHTERGASSEERLIGLEFSDLVTIPIPFSILFYHPGSIVASRDLVFSVARSALEDRGAPGKPDTATPVFDLSLTGGSVLVDIDDWLEVLFRAYLEDTWITHIVFFTWQGDWIGLLAGDGRRTGRELRAYFDFTRNRILFPAPDSLDVTGKALLAGAQSAPPAAPGSTAPGSP
jgi:hypothetical protein